MALKGWTHAAVHSGEGMYTDRLCELWGTLAERGYTHGYWACGYVIYVTGYVIWYWVRDTLLGMRYIC